MNPFDFFTKTKDFLVCVDSDGCAMDTMDIKHFRCFGPCMVDEWHLDAWRAPILDRWNELNLYQMTRGINRFKGLAMALAEIHQQYTPIDGLAALENWVETTKALSNDALTEAIEQASNETTHAVLTKALHWSQAVNASINTLPESEKKPFAGVQEGLAAAAKVANVAIVSSANRDAVMDEWQANGLLDHVDIVLAQDCGSKAHCIAKLLEQGYAPDHVLMVGDALGDRDAAAKNGVYFYPIQVRKEQASWDALEANALVPLTNGSYGDYEPKHIADFVANLGG